MKSIPFYANKCQYKLVIYREMLYFFFCFQHRVVGNQNCFSNINWKTTYVFTSNVLALMTEVVEKTHQEMKEIAFGYTAIFYLRSHVSFKLHKVEMAH